MEETQDKGQDARPFEADDPSYAEMSRVEEPRSEPVQENRPRRTHGRRPPLAEIDTWELWLAWKRGDRSVALPWIGLLVSFCMVLAGMYSFFFFSTSLTGDTVAMVVLTLVFVAFMFTLWRRISSRRDFAFLVVMLILLVSGIAFLIWLTAYRASGWNAWVGIFGTLVLGLLGIVAGLPSLNAIARRQE